MWNLDILCLDKTDQVIEKYGSLLLCSIGFYIVFFKFGITNIILKLMKQISLLLLMTIVCFIWLALFNNHLADINSSSLSYVYAAFVSKDYSTILLDTKFVTPASEIVLVTGSCIFILSMLYRQLPIDLVPDCLPFIGKCDNVIAGFFAFIGIIIVAIGIYLQLNYADVPNSSVVIMQLIREKTQNALQFWCKNEQEKMNTLQELLLVLLQKTHFILKQLFGEIQKNFGK